MRSKSVELKNQIYDYVNARKRETGSSPSLSEIGDQFGYNKSTIYRYLVEMNKDGMLFYDGNSIDTTEANEYNMSLAAAKIVGSILGWPLYMKALLKKTAARLVFFLMALIRCLYIALIATKKCGITQTQSTRTSITSAVQTM